MCECVLNAITCVEHSLRLSCVYFFPIILSSPPVSPLTLSSYSPRHLFSIHLFSGLLFLRPSLSPSCTEVSTEVSTDTRTTLVTSGGTILSNQRLPHPGVRPLHTECLHAACQLSPFILYLGHLGGERFLLLFRNALLLLLRRTELLLLLTLSSRARDEMCIEGRGQRTEGREQRAEGREDRGRMRVKGTALEGKAGHCVSLHSFRPSP